VYRDGDHEVERLTLTNEGGHMAHRAQLEIINNPRNEGRSWVCCRVESLDVKFC